MTTTGIVLCGGRSSRMGRDKPWLPWRGRPVLAHVVDRLAQAVDELVVVCAPGQSLPPTPARRVEDAEEGLGPLAGLSAGLAASAPGLTFVTAADAPFLTPAFVRAVLAPGAAAAPEAGGQVHPLSAAYPSGAAGQARALLDAGQRRPLELLEHLGFQRLALSDLPDPASVSGFNTPDEYLAAARDDVPEATAQVEFVGQGTRRPPCPVPIGTLAEILRAAGAEAKFFDGQELASPYAARLKGEGMLRDMQVPIGAGEEITIVEETGSTTPGSAPERTKA
ncbi:MAG: molybdenum cofactor guanylyltransferase [Myxococcota bacterium]|nr:molybdenum cofactor guanylyltransferase [Myxococcota bacterium]